MAAGHLTDLALVAVFAILPPCRDRSAARWEARLISGRHRRRQVLDEVGQRYGAPLRAVEQAHAHRLGLLVAVAENQDVRNLGELGVANLRLHPAARAVDLRAQAGGPEGAGHGGSAPA